MLPYGINSSQWVKPVWIHSIGRTRTNKCCLLTVVWGNTEEYCLWSEQLKGWMCDRSVFYFLQNSLEKSKPFPWEPPPANCLICLTLLLQQTDNAMWPLAGSVTFWVCWSFQPRYFICTIQSDYEFTPHMIYIYISIFSASGMHVSSS